MNMIAKLWAESLQSISEKEAEKIENFNDSLQSYLTKVSNRCKL